MCKHTTCHCQVLHKRNHSIPVLNAPCWYSIRVPSWGKHTNHDQEKREQLSLLPMLRSQSLELVLSYNMVWSQHDHTNLMSHVPYIWVPFSFNSINLPSTIYPMLHPPNLSVQTDKTYEFVLKKNKRTPPSCQILSSVLSLQKHNWTENLSKLPYISDVFRERQGIQLNIVPVLEASKQKKGKMTRQTQRKKPEWMFTSLENTTLSHVLVDVY